jgi:hypothetical protein
MMHSLSKLDSRLPRFAKSMSRCSQIAAIALAAAGCAATSPAAGRRVLPLDRLAQSAPQLGAAPYLRDVRLVDWGEWYDVELDLGRSRLAESSPLVIDALVARPAVDAWLFTDDGEPVLRIEETSDRFRFSHAEPVSALGVLIVRSDRYCAVYRVRQ